MKKSNKRALKRISRVCHFPLKFPALAQSPGQRVKIICHSAKTVKTNILCKFWKGLNKHTEVPDINHVQHLEIIRDFIIIKVSCGVYECGCLGRDGG